MYYQGNLDVVEAADIADVASTGPVVTLADGRQGVPVMLVIDPASGKSWDTSSGAAGPTHLHITNGVWHKLVDLFGPAFQALFAAAGETAPAASEEPEAPATPESDSAGQEASQAPETSETSSAAPEAAPASAPEAPAPAEEVPASEAAAEAEETEATPAEPESEAPSA